MIRGYCRVSTTKQADKGESIENQEKTIYEYLRRCCPGEPRVVFSDLGVSAATPLASRQYGGMIFQDSKAGDTVVVTKLDRLFRSTSDAINTCLTWNARGVRLVVLSFGGSPLDTGTPHGKLMLVVLSAFSEFEREMARDRTRDAMARIKTDGRARTTLRPFGYVLGPSRELVPNPAEMWMLENMISSKSGGSTREIAARLNEARVLTPSGAKWSHGIVARVIKNELARRKQCATR